jgi:large subunit ribosomal protein L6
VSRVGKVPITVPDGVKVDVGADEIRVEGPRGALAQPILDGVSAALVDNQIRFTCERPNDRAARSFYGLLRTLVNNMVTGVTEGFQQELEIHGVGFRAEMEGSELVLVLGFSRSIRFPIPPGIECAVDKQTKLTIKGLDKQQVGQVAASIRKLRPPEPYQGKGIRYVGEQIRRKVGKTGAA